MFTRTKNFAHVVVMACTLVLVLLFCGVLQGQVPQISQPLVPAAVTPGSSGLTLTVNGTGFTPNSNVLWNGSARPTTFVSSTRITAEISASDVGAPGTAAVTVLTSTFTSNVAYFEITNPTTSVSFSETDFGSGPQPLSVTAGDFNHDGTLDLALANNGDNSVSVLFGNGGGTFHPAGTYNTGPGTNWIDAAKLRNNGLVDLVVSSAGTAYGAQGSVNILLNNGDGTFQPAASYPAGSNPAIGGVGDFNGDGVPDIVVPNNAGSNISVLLGNGNGTFQPPVNYPTGAAPSMLAVGDFNGDGNLDVAVVDTLANTVSILLGIGNGTFQPAVNYPVGSYPIRIVDADFDGDGKLDVVVLNQQSNNVSVLLGRGDGTFQPQVNYAVSPAAFGLTVVDLNGDGKLDLVMVNNSGHGVTGLFGNGNGTFQPAVSYAGGSSPFDVAAGDFNNDGRMDLAIANNSNPGSVSILLQPTPYSAQIQPPIASDGSSVFQGRGVVPVKFTLELGGLSTCNLPAATISLTEISGSSPGPVNEIDYNLGADNGNNFRISSCQYVYNLGAKNLGVGSYEVQITISGSVVGSGLFGLQ